MSWAVESATALRIERRVGELACDKCDVVIRSYLTPCCGVSRTLDASSAVEYKLVAPAEVRARIFRSLGQSFAQIKVLFKSILTNIPALHNHPVSIGGVPDVSAHQHNAGI